MKTIFVVGDLILDKYIWGTATRISPEAPVPVVNVKKESAGLGGAGNVVNNLKSLGAEISIFSVIGTDGELILKLLSGLDVNTDNIICSEKRKTTVKSRLIAGHNHIVRFDDEITEFLDPDLEDELFTKFKDKIACADTVVISDYGKGVISDNICKKIIELCSLKNIPVIIDPKGKDYSKYTGATLITPNKKEASEASNIEIVDEKSLIKAGKLLLNSCGLKYLVITLSKDGIALFDKSSVHVIPSLAREVYDVTGAGDTVVAALSYKFGDNMIDCCEFANRAAAIAVSKIGPVAVKLNEVEEYKYKSFDNFNKVKNIDEIISVADNNRKHGKKIVFTNGCFDIIHSGHVFYLKEAKKLGDVLILGLNSDESINKLKGANRPIFIEKDRIAVLSSFEMIDYIVVFSQSTPIDIIKAIKPDVLVKGGDYKKSEIVGNEFVSSYGGKVETVEFIKGRSTSDIINFIKKRL